MVSDKELPPNGSLQAKVLRYQPILTGQIRYTPESVSRQDLLYPLAKGVSASWLDSPEMVSCAIV
jgi:hypothetical protein